MDKVFRHERFVEDDPTNAIIQLGTTRPAKVDYPFSQSMFDISDNAIVDLLENEGNDLLKAAWEKGKSRFNAKRKSLQGMLDNDYFAIAVIAYTMEQPKMYSDFNKATREYSTRTSRHYNYSSYLCLLQKAVDNRAEEFPVFKKTLYRGVNAKFETTYGMFICFRSFTSTSLNKNESLKFIGQDPSGSTLFQIWNGYGLSLEPFSEYPYEQEVLLLPYTLYKVLSVEKDRLGLTIITLDCLQTSPHGTFK